MRRAKDRRAAKSSRSAIALAIADATSPFRLTLLPAGSELSYTRALVRERALTRPR
jgi:hypothetical protein